jgi:hypothetical protein
MTLTAIMASLATTVGHAPHCGVYGIFEDRAGRVGVQQRRT